MGWDHSKGHRAWRRAVVPMMVVFCFVYGFLYCLIAPYMMAAFLAPLALMGLLTIWALPDMKVAPTGILNFLFFGLMLSLIWPNYLALALPGLPWITMQRLFSAPMCLTLLLCLSISQNFRSELKRSVDGAPWVWRFLVIFVAAQGLSVIVSTNPTFSLQKVINSQFVWTSTFFASAFLFLKPGRATRWAAIFCMTLIPIVAIGYPEFMLKRVLWANHIPSFLQIDDESVRFTLAGGIRNGNMFRVTTVFTSPLGLGEYVALAMPFLLHFVASPIKMIYRIGAAILVPLSIDIVLLSDARLGLIGCMLSFAAYILLYSIFWWRRHRESLIATTALVAYPVFLVLFILASIFLHPIRSRIFGSGQYEASNMGRVDMYSQWIPLMLQRPWGYGAGLAAQTMGITDLNGKLQLDTYYVLIGLDYGVLGFVVYYGMLIAAASKATKGAFNATDRTSESMLFLPLSVALTNFLIIKLVFSVDFNHPLIYAMLGMLCALVCRFPIPTTAKSRSSARTAEKRAFRRAPALA